MDSVTHNGAVRASPSPAAPAVAASAPAPGSGVFGRCKITPRIRSYMLEWLLTLFVLVIPLALAYVSIPFRDRNISLLDANIQQPYYPLDSLPILSVFIPTVVVPLVCFVIYPLALAKYSERMGLPPHPFSWHYTYWWSSCLIQTVGLTVLLSELMKRLIQAPRPDFLWRCFPDGIPAAIQAAAAANNYIVNTELCTPRDRYTLEDGLMSLPSEHTSLACCMTMTLSLFFLTLRRELIAHETRLGRQIRAAQRDALVARLVAAGVAPRRARKLAASASSAGSDESTGCIDRAKRDDRLDGFPSPELLAPPTLIDEPEVTPSPIPRPETILAHITIEHAHTHHGHTLNVPHAHRNGTHHHGAATPAAAAAAASSSSSTSSSLLTVPEAQVPSDHAHASASPRPEVSVVVPAQDVPAPAVVSFWPNSHVVYIAHILFPVGWAISVGLSRTFDHRHSFTDVLIGGVLGTTVALAVYRMHLVKFQGYHQRWNGHCDREHKEMDEHATDKHRRAQAQGLLESDREDDEENQLQQPARLNPMVQFDGAALGPAPAPQQGAPAALAVQLHQPRPRGNSQPHVLAPQESMESHEVPTIHSLQATLATMQAPSRTQSREEPVDPAAGGRTSSFSHGPADLSAAGQSPQNGKPHSLPGRVDSAGGADNV